jgi:hypothetical protein
MKNVHLFTMLAATFMLLCCTASYSQNETDPLTANERASVVDSVSKKLIHNYVFPEVANNMAASLRSKLKNGSYNTINDPQELASVLTRDLQEVSKDKHIRVSFAPRQIAEQNEAVTAEDSLRFLNRWINSMKRNNFGFQEMKILEGNIGYLDLRSFSNVEYAGETAVAAMNFLSSSDAIIIDLRQNGGGSPAMIQLISSYLFGSEPVHLNNFYWRPNDSNSQTWTLPHVYGKRSPDTPVYVLTSGRTFSAAEEFSYNLKNLNRATLIGETTGGGAHPGGSVIATNRFMVWVPTGRAINPITNTNWEGTGVSPHFEVPAEDALDLAHLKALQTLAKKNKDPELVPYYQWYMDALEVRNNPVTVDTKILKKYAGNYGPRNVIMEEGKLYYQRENGPKYMLTPLSETEFLLNGLSSFRIKFLKENGNVVALEGHYDNGRTDKNLRTN